MRDGYAGARIARRVGTHRLVTETFVRSAFMTCCPHCVGAEDFFGERMARHELRRYRKKGPSVSTRRLLEAIGAPAGHDETLLDIGGGVGAIDHELLAAGMPRAIHVEASASYLKAAEQESERHGWRDRVTHHHGDFVDLAPTLPDADVVTLDRVICCYPDVDRLVELSAAKAKRVYGLVYPRERWAVRTVIGLGNLFLRLRRTAFRVYVHRSRAVDAAVTRSGFHRSSYSRTFFWQIVTYTR